MNATGIKKGFTLLEILISVAILIALGTFSISPLMSFYRTVVLQGNVENVLAMLDEARKSTLSSYKSSQYGVHFETDKAVLFTGDTYSAVDPSNDIYLFSSNVEVTEISFSGGGDDVVFERITGETTESGILVITQLAGESSSSTIEIHPSGLVEVY